MRVQDVQNKLMDEPARLAALDRCQILDTAPEAAFDKITSLVQTVMNVPISIVSLVAKDRQWLKSMTGPVAANMPRTISFCTHTIERREPMVIADAAEDKRFASNPVVLGPPFIRSYLGIPLSSPDGYNLGALCALDTKPRSFDATQIQIMTSFAALVMDELELRLIAKSDFLTGALTRRAFGAALNGAWAAFQDGGRESALIIFDIDHFKRINDERGHAAGDLVLSSVAQFVRETMPPEAELGRLGGEEFAVLLPDMDRQTARSLTEALRSGLAAYAIPGMSARPVTASFGVATTVPSLASVADWIARADLLMYEAKQSGRNRCRFDMSVD
ncbi:sensor domain-containing diguanylate cyclase [Acidisoma cellulosilytica]|uniref:Sensor domain-containing diguanylate cyclase n=1 Tax=Acidisoma cellulosilyticum TaxID=2802395 RepID=A0A963Z4J7_9PROT|nr:sensor domain-containing diguanylate cyclase [Acidisoma cellulosilyticum]MCB8882504.1 sensor domain-containing diguanylate cyclase [Acidisoma cellulosilyticum]